MYSITQFCRPSLSAVAQHGHDHNAYLSVREAANQIIRRQHVVDRELLQLLRQGYVELKRKERGWEVDLTEKGMYCLSRGMLAHALPLDDSQLDG